MPQQGTTVSQGPSTARPLGLQLQQHLLVSFPSAQLCLSLSLQVHLLSIPPAGLHDTAPGLRAASREPNLSQGQLSQCRVPVNVPEKSQVPAEGPQRLTTLGKILVIQPYKNDKCLIISSDHFLSTYPSWSGTGVKEGTRGTGGAQDRVAGPSTPSTFHVTHYMTLPTVPKPRDSRAGFP